MSSPREDLPKLAQAVQLARATADQPNPPERLVYWNGRHNLGAVMDPFNPQRCSVVACLGEVAAANETVHLSEIPPSRRQMLGLVVHTVGRKMLLAARAFGENQYTIERAGEERDITADEAGEERVLERVVGFAQPRIGHVVLGLGVRFETPAGRPDEDTLNRNWGHIRVVGEEAAALDRQLEAQSLIGQLLDDPHGLDSLELMEQMALLVE